MIRCETDVGKTQSTSIGNHGNKPSLILRFIYSFGPSGHILCMFEALNNGHFHSQETNLDPYEQHKR